MSVEAMAWAFRQKLPPKPKIVLLALADQTDEVTGRVCYGQTDAKHLAGKSGVSERSLYRYIGALIRNGYALRESGKAKGQENEFWLCLDRLAAKSAKEFLWAKDEAADEPADSEPDVETEAEPQDVGEGSAKLADPPNAPNWQTPSAIVGRPEDSFDNQRTSSRTREGTFSKAAQDLARGDPKPQPEQPWNSYPANSPEGIALRIAFQIVGKEGFFETTRLARGNVHHRGPISPQLIALGQASPKREWPKVDHRQAAAWNELLGPVMPSIWSRLVAGSHAPWPWPPRKDGSLCTGPPDEAAA